VKFGRGLGKLAVNGVMDLPEGCMKCCWVQCCLLVRAGQLVADVFDNCVLPARVCLIQLLYIMCCMVWVWES
jgi:hypothetical protein